MRLQDMLSRQGTWLFRWRGLLPVIMIPLALLALQDLRHNPLPQRENLWDPLCVLLGFTGLIMRGAIVGYAPRGASSRKTRRPEGETLNTTGLYSVMRHPLYAANFLMFLGLLLFLGVWWFVLAGTLAYWLYYERIMLAEEAYLVQRFGRRFHVWATTTPALLPRFSLWRPPVEEFSMRKVLRREYNGFLVLVAGFAALEIAECAVLNRTPDAYILPAASLAAALGVFTVLRTLSRHTRLLHASSR